MNTEDDNLNDTSGENELSALYREADDAAPPASLDESILAAAKQAVEHNAVSQRSSRAPFSGRWLLAASAAAVVVIAILLVPLLERQAPPTESTQPFAMDDLFNADEQAEAKMAVRERLPASNPGRLYAPAPAQMPAMPQRSAMDADHASAAGRSGAAAPAIKKGRRSNARLNAASSAPLAIFTPEMWLVKIQQLMESGKIAEARDELERFRQAHPDYEFDQNLMERLKQP